MYSMCVFFFILRAAFCCPLVQDKSLLASITSECMFEHMYLPLSARSKHVRNGFMKEAIVYQALCMDNIYSLISRLSTELPTEDKACCTDQ